MESKELISIISAFKSPIIEKFGEWKDEITFLFDNGLIDYIDNYGTKFEQTKTFLFRDKKIDFHKTYFPVTLRFSNKKFKVDAIESLYNIGTCITIIGNAGSGKSMQMKYIFLRAIEQGVKIPIFIELKDLNNFEGGLTEFIYNKILKNGLSKNEKILKDILSTGNFLFLFDGYDEIYSDKKHHLTSQIENFVDTYSRNWYLITSRPNAGIESLPRFNNIYVESLKMNEIEQFIEQQCQIIDNLDLSSKIKSLINKEENKEYLHYLSSPLLLSMFIFTYNEHPELPKKKSKFYWNVINTLLVRHDSFTKGGAWQHERKSKLQNDEIEMILQYFGYYTLFSGVINHFSEEYLSKEFKRIKDNHNFKFQTTDIIYDLSVNLGLLIKDGLDYVFPHRSMQEYLAVKLISIQTEDLKKKIYQKKIPNNRLSIFGGNLSFWNLCLELDEVSFIKYGIIHYLSIILGLFSSSSKEQKIKAVYDLSNFGYKFHIKDNSNRFSISGFTYKSNFTNDILKLLKLKTLEDIAGDIHYDLLQDQEFIKFVNSNISIELSSTILFKPSLNEDFPYLIFEKYKFLESLNQLLSKLKDIKLFYENKLVLIDNSASNLL